MSIVRRMRDITAATINEHLERCEDPVQLIDRYLAEQSEQIRQTGQLLQQCKTHTERLKFQYVTASQLRDKREEQALTAMKAGEENLARLALQEKILQEEKAEQYRELYDQGTRQVDELEAEWAQLKADYQEVYQKRQYYSARLESIRLQRRMNERMRGFGYPPGDRLFHRLEERVGDMELEIGSLREVRRLGSHALRQAGDHVREALDQELERLRNKLNREGRTN